MDDLTYSRRNCPYFETTSVKAGKSLARIMFAYEKYRQQDGQQALSAKNKELYRRHFEIVFLDLHSAWLGDPRKYVGYSRGKSAFLRGGSYWHPKYDKPLLSGTVFKAVIEFMQMRGFLENHIAKQGYGGFSSRMRATPKLAQTMEAMGLNSATIRIDPDAPVILIKNKKKKLLTYPKTHQFDLEEAEWNLKRINKNLELTYLNLDITDKAYRLLLDRMHGDDKEADREPIEFSNRSLRRIFRDDFSKGGRFYGGWWQGVPSELRKFIVIDGAMTREMDYSTIQPRIMYAEMDVEPPKDAYLPEGWANDVRPISKKAFNQLVNSDKTSRNENQWHRFGPNLDPEEKPNDWNELTEYQKVALRRDQFDKTFGRPYSDLLRDLMIMHEPIDEFLFSGAWGAMQRKDSDIAEQVMTSLLDKDVPVTALPIHDSFIVRRGAEHELKQTMEKAFESVVGVEGKVDLSEAVYDVPPGFEGPRFLSINEIEDEVRNDINEKKEYNRREIEWQRAHGPVDV